MTTMVCPSCGAPQAFGLLCSDDTGAMLGMLAAVPQLIEQLDVAISRQAKVGNGGKAGKGSAHLRSPINLGAMEVRDELEAVAAIWGALSVDMLRRDPNVARGVVVVGRSVKNAYRAIDRAQERTYLGRCFNATDGEECQAELWARPHAKEVECRLCRYVHNVADRRLDMLEMARDQVCTPKEASNYVGEVGGVRVGHQRIRNYLDRGRIAERPSPDGVKRLRLGDLLDVLGDDAARHDAQAS